VKDRPPAERIQSRLRELTDDHRRLRQELEELLRRPEPDRTRAFRHERLADLRTERWDKPARKR
jgi:hypothetical protein